jgi:hypothetical protein
MSLMTSPFHLHPSENSWALRLANSNHFILKIDVPGIRVVGGDSLVGFAFK